MRNKCSYDLKKGHLISVLPYNFFLYVITYEDQNFYPSGLRVVCYFMSLYLIVYFISKYFVFNVIFDFWLLMSFHMYTDINTGI